MKLSNYATEQITNGGVIVVDKGEILSTTELLGIVQSSFHASEIRQGMCFGNYHGKLYCLCVRNISYLGIPHPIHKKRIQIPHQFITAYYDNQKKGIVTFFIGVYKYKDIILFVNFDTSLYLQNKAHNSSAHVLTVDLSNAEKNGFYVKTDNRNNEICSFSNAGIDRFFKMYLVQEEDYTPKIYSMFDEFYDLIPHQWTGVECYTQMIMGNYHRKFQPEWPGTYLEFLFEQYVQQDFFHGLVEYNPERGGEGIDLDLFFPEICVHGDLKAHSNKSSGILGNRTETIEKLLTEKQSIFYIVFDHNTRMDSECNYVVTEFWNDEQNKTNKRSYSKRMKNSILLTDYMILEISNNNYHYINGSFQKGFKNSDGNLRSSKIAISKSDLENFVIHKHSARDKTTK